MLLYIDLWGDCGLLLTELLDFCIVDLRYRYEILFQVCVVLPLCGLGFVTGDYYLVGFGL